MLYTDTEVQTFDEWLGIGPNAAKNVLDKIAPTIAARALREAAETWGLGMSATDQWRGSTVAAELRDRADEIEAGQS